MSKVPLKWPRVTGFRFRAYQGVAEELELRAHIVDVPSTLITRGLLPTSRNVSPPRIFIGAQASAYGRVLGGGVF